MLLYTSTRPKMNDSIESFSTLKLKNYVAINSLSKRPYIHKDENELGPILWTNKSLELCNNEAVNVKLHDEMIRLLSKKKREKRPDRN